MKAKVYQGIDNLAAMDKALSGYRLGVAASGGAMNKAHRHSLDVLWERYRVTALFNTVMGIRGEYRYGEDVPAYTDPATGQPVHSIFCLERLAPTDEMLSQVDVMVVDFRDAGVRFFEYLHCCAAILKACAQAKKPLVVLDRIAPLGGEAIEGTVCPPDMHTIVGDYGLPTRTGVTLGEFIRYVNGAYGIGGELTVIPLQGWRRSMYHDDTDIPWLLPSPSLPHVTANLIYAGMGLLEGIENLSEGRGTTKPFEMVGAPWLRHEPLCRALNRLDLPGVSFAPVYFKPTASKYKGEVCQGIQFILRDKRAFAPFHTALTLLDTIEALHDEPFRYLDINAGHHVLRQPSSPAFARYFDMLLATDAFVAKGEHADQITGAYAPQRAQYWEAIKPYLLYD